MHFSYNEQVSLDDLIGKTISAIDGMCSDSEQVTLYTTDGYAYGFYHSQSCCENVYLEDVNGDVTDLLSEPITVSEETTGSFPPAQDNYSDIQWTFYRLATRKGYVVLRWYGSSNGYYSTDVSFAKRKVDE